jgi:hypothetical protein
MNTWTPGPFGTPTFGFNGFNSFPSFPAPNQMWNQGWHQGQGWNGYGAPFTSTPWGNAFCGPMNGFAFANCGANGCTPTIGAWNTWTNSIPAANWPSNTWPTNTWSNGCTTPWNGYGWTIPNTGSPTGFNTFPGFSGFNGFNGFAGTNGFNGYSSVPGFSGSNTSWGVSNPWGFAPNGCLGTACPDFTGNVCCTTNTVGFNGINSGFGFGTPTDVWSQGTCAVVSTCFGNLPCVTSTQCVPTVACGPNGAQISGIVINGCFVPMSLLASILGVPTQSGVASGINGGVVNGTFSSFQNGGFQNGGFPTGTGIPGTGTPNPWTNGRTTTGPVANTPVNPFAPTAYSGTGATKPFGGSIPNTVLNTVSNTVPGTVPHTMPSTLPTNVNPITGAPICSPSTPGYMNAADCSQGVARSAA